MPKMFLKSQIMVLALTGVQGVKILSVHVCVYLGYYKRELKREPVKKA